MKNTLPILAGLLLLPLFAGETGSLSLEMRNRSLAEGANVEDGTRFLHSNIDLSAHGVELGLESIQALSGDYRELSATLGFGFEFGALSITPSLTRIWFPDIEEESHTWELSLILGADLTETVTFEAEGRWDFDEAKAGFIELTLASSRGGSDLTLEPYVALGLDVGLVSGKRKLKDNHVEVGTVLELALNERFSAFTTLSYSFALSALHAEGGGNIAWFGIGLRSHF